MAGVEEEEEENMEESENKGPEKISPCCTCAKTCFYQENTLRLFPGTPTTS